MNLNEMHLLYKQNKIDFEEACEIATPFISRIIYKSERYKRDYNDYFQEASLILYELLETFNCEKHEFGAVFTKRVKWRFAEYSWYDTLIRKPKYLHDRKIDQQNYIIVTSEKDDFNLIDEFKVTNSFEDNSLSKVYCQDKIRILTRHELKIISLVLQGYSYREIGIKLEKSKESIAQSIRQIIKQIETPNFTKEELFVIKNNLETGVKELSSVLGKHYKKVEKAIESEKDWRTHEKIN